MTTSVRDLFLPFTPKGLKAEMRAIEAKQKLRYGPYASIDPFGVLSRVPARLLTPVEFQAGPPHVYAALWEDPPDDLSAFAMGRSPSTGEWLIYVNPLHHEHRQRTSLMEEIAHISLEHPPSKLYFEGGKPKRTYNEEVEDEAFCVGAACIIPYRDLFNAIKRRHEKVNAIAERYNVSEALVEYRIKRAGLSKVYKANCE